MFKFVEGFLIQGAICGIILVQIDSWFSSVNPPGDQVIDRRNVLTENILSQTVIPCYK